MSKCYAVAHIGVGVRRYKPGDELPQLTDDQWKRLSRIGAIRTEIDPVEVTLEIADEEENAQTPAHSEEPENKAEQDATGEPEEIEEEMPEIDVMDGLAEPEAKPKARKSAKKAAK